MYAHSVASSAAMKYTEQQSITKAGIKNIVSQPTSQRPNLDAWWTNFDFFSS